MGCDTVSIGKPIFSKEPSAGVFGSWFFFSYEDYNISKKFSEILVKIYQTKQRHISEDSVLDRNICTA